MAASYIGRTYGNGSSSSPSVSKPTLSDGDLLIAIVHANGGTNTITDNNGGYSFIEEVDEVHYNGPSATYSVFTRYVTDASSEPSTYNWTLASSDRWTVVLLQIRGAYENFEFVHAPNSANDNTGTTSGWSSTSLTNTWNDALAFVYVLNDTNSHSQTAGTPTGWTESIRLGGYQFQHVFYKSVDSGDTVQASDTMGFNNGVWLAGTFVVKPGGNIAPDGTASASTEYSATYSADKANDEVESTKWLSSTTDNDTVEQWWKIDLGSNYDIDEIHLTWEDSSYTYTYNIKSSTDDSSYSTEVAQSTATSDKSHYDLGITSVRYIKIDNILLSTGAVKRSRLKEVDIRGTVASTPATINASVQAITSSQPAATVEADQAVDVDVGVESLSATQPTATVEAGQAVTTEPSTLTITVTQPSPTITADKVVEVDLEAQTITASTELATVEPDKLIELDPAVQSLSLSQPTAAVTALQQVDLDLGVQALTATQLGATVDAENSAEATPDALVLSVSQPEPTVTADQTVSIDLETQSLTAVQEEAETLQAVSIDLETQTIISSVPDLTVTSDETATVNLSEKNLTLSLPAPTVTADKTVEITPEAQVVTVSAQDTTQAVSKTIDLEVQGLSLSLPEATATGAAISSIAVEELSVTLPEIEVITDTIVNQNTSSVNVTAPDVAVKVGVTIDMPCLEMKKPDWIWIDYERLGKHIKDNNYIRL